MWNRKHSENFEWFCNLAATGVNVKPLNERPELNLVELFYYNLYMICGSDFNKICKYCELYNFENDEILEAIKIASVIEKGVK